MLNPAQADQLSPPLPGPGLLGAGRCIMTPHAYTSDRQRPAHSVVWVLEMFTQGHMQLAIEQTPPRQVTPGWGALYAPGTRYREVVAPAQSCHSVVVYFDVGQDMAQLRLADLRPGHRLIYDPRGLLRDLARRIAQRHIGHEAHKLAATGDFFHAMSLLSAAHDDGHTLGIGSSADDDLVARAQRFMTEHLDQPIGVADLARHAGMSQSGFAHAYRRLAGVSPAQDLRRIRVEAVKAHLLHNRHTLAHIAQLTGFADAFHLSHAFRKVAGVSPRHFKQSAGQRYDGPAHG